MGRSSEGLAARITVEFVVEAWKGSREASFAAASLSVEMNAVSVGVD